MTYAQMEPVKRTSADKEELKRKRMAAMALPPTEIDQPRSASTEKKTINNKETTDQKEFAETAGDISVTEEHEVPDVNLKTEESVQTSSTKTSASTIAKEDTGNVKPKKKPGRPPKAASNAGKNVQKCLMISQRTSMALSLWAAQDSSHTGSSLVDEAVEYYLKNKNKFLLEMVDMMMSQNHE